MKQVQKPKKPIIFYYVIALIVILLLNLLLFPRLLEPKVTEVDYGKFLQMVDNMSSFFEYFTCSPSRP